MKPKPYRAVFTLSVVCAITACLAMPVDSTPIKEDHVIGKKEIEKYMTILENLNIDRIVTSPRLILSVKCFLDEGPCTAQLKDLKSVRALLYRAN
jgi:hypothetical protein